MARVLKVLFGALVLGAMAACGVPGGPIGEQPITPEPAPTLPGLVSPSAPDYVTMNDTRAISVPVSGSGFDTIYYETSSVRELTGPDAVSGRYSTSDGALILDLGGRSFVVRNGANGSGNLIMDAFDANGDHLGTSTATIAEYGPAYQYVKSVLIKGPYERLNGRIVVAPIWFGSIGIVTNPADMPTAGTATFAGGAALNYTGGPNVALNGNKELVELGTSAITADFGAGTANVDLIFTSSAQPEFSQTRYYLTVSRVSGAGLQISGNSMSGGSWTALGGNVSVFVPLPNASEVPVDMVGRVLATTTAAETTTITSTGSFYGYDSASSGPAELTGRVMVDGYTTDSQGVTSSDGSADYTYWAIHQP